MGVIRAFRVLIGDPKKHVGKNFLEPKYKLPIDSVVEGGRGNGLRFARSFEEITQLRLLLQSLARELQEMPRRYVLDPLGMVSFQMISIVTSAPDSLPGGRKKEEWHTGKLLWNA